MSPENAGLIAGAIALTVWAVAQVMAARLKRQAKRIEANSQKEIKDAERQAAEKAAEPQRIINEAADLKRANETAELNLKLQQQAIETGKQYSEIKDTLHAVQLKATQD